MSNTIFAQMVRFGARRLTGMALSALLVVAPALGAWACARLVWRTTTSGEATLDPGAALLRLAGLGCTLVLIWATAAVAAGVREGWARVSAGPAGPPGQPGTSGSADGAPRDRRPRPAPVAPGGVVSATVAALVVAALTAPVAAAHPGAPERPPATEQPADPTTDPMVDPPPQDATAPHESPVPGSWQVLARDGFSAPRGASPTAASLVTSRSTRAQPAPREVVVTAGDTLWGVVSAHLGPGAGDAEVARTWPAWWQANRSVIGDDPDLLLPGQRLVVPPPA
jgi:resuscitation-promoting factor RpfA